MYGMWFLQFRMSGKTSAETGNRSYEKDCNGEPQKEKIIRERRRGEQK